MQNKYSPRSIALQLLLGAACIPFVASAQGGRQGQNRQAQTINLTDLSAFKSPGATWSVAASVTADREKANTITKKDGSGILVNIPGKEHGQDLFTNMEHGDIDLSFDFMMPKESNSGVYLQGRYEIQLLDSWGKKALSPGDLGGIYERWDENRPAGRFGYDGVAPRLNVSRAPGLWQNMRIVFQAPKFEGGKKVANARIIRIALNGVTIIENAEMQGPTRGSAFADEAAMGPIRIQGDHGAVAFRNIRYSNNVAAAQTDGTRQVWDQNEKPVTVDVQGEPMIFRSFVDIPGKRVTHAANVGLLNNISFGYDLSNGGLFQIWKGGFLDASPMWLSRGDGNSRALGSVISLNDMSSIAVLSDANVSWPDTLAKGDFQPKGYDLDEAGVPTFKSIFKGLAINDKLTSDDGKSLLRTISVDGPASKAIYVRAAAGTDIADLGNGMYAVNNFTYYVQIDKSLKPVLRNGAKGQELIIPLKNTDKGTSVQYSIIW
ncbi:3-keto-disaccharide hydrolase [Mucilaginibacter myungsuensis]|uniref:DUF1080 domain-containing protein n=1 Tax=Mucilaginibacter myungsuensis TaxID=649104 RepID=A0A929PX73_9SPHI|nr:DUF1080 domain-containing protein [Mucilaginibacter myungsuensis]MBE9661927.1 DUF1080 domain-containing protein [Mucilaginibacter myungsuensis]MDN3599639.1 DUF1080 domain-containing protein [Mucilaginibacter myungsuensis]